VPALIGVLIYIGLTVLFSLTGQAVIAGTLIFVGAVILVILFHEAGHFASAKAFGIKVDEFFIGFGPRLWSVRRGETEYGVKAIPAGGYVRIAGMNPYEETPVEDLPRTFGAKPRWQRAIVLVAGALTHFVLAFLLLVVFFSAIGQEVALPRIDEVVQELDDGSPTPASTAGFRAGDVLVSVDGVAIESWDQARDYISAHPGQRITFVVERDGRRLTIAVTPASIESGGETLGFIGLAPVVETRKDNVIVAFGHAGTTLVDLVGQSFKAIARVFGPEGLGRIGRLLIGRAERDVTDPVGLVGAARLSGQAVAGGAVGALIGLLAGFNVFVGIVNLLPLPPLDGGHLAVLAIEGVTGKRIDPRRLVPITALVAGFLILFTISVLYLDIASPIPNPFR